MTSKAISAIILATVSAIPLIAQDSSEKATPKKDPYAEMREAGPQSLAIQYRCNPDQRAALRQLMVNGGVGRFETWKQRGILKDYHILFNSYLDSETFDMLILLTFGDSG